MCESKIFVLLEYASDLFNVLDVVPCKEEYLPDVHSVGLLETEQSPSRQGLYSAVLQNALSYESC